MASDQIEDELRERIRAQLGNRCGYCLAPQHLVYALLEVEHINPRAKGGTDDESNLCLSCRLCNNFKGVRTDALDPVTASRDPLFNPRQQKWNEHFAWSTDGIRILVQTACGRATVVALRLNNVIAMTVRREWVSAHWHPPRTE